MLKSTYRSGVDIGVRTNNLSLLPPLEPSEYTAHSEVRMQSFPLASVLTKKENTKSVKNE